MSNQKKTVLITGVAGLLGANLAQYLCDEGYRVVGADNLQGGYREFVDPRVEFYQVDLTFAPDVDYLFDAAGKVDYIYHFAAYAACGYSPFVRSFNYKNNIGASVLLINEAVNRDIEKFIFASSMTVYGDQQTPFTEDMPMKPSDPYAIAKMAVELDLKDAFDRFGLNYAVVRPHNVHGIFQNVWDKYRNVIGIFIRKALNGDDLLVYGDGSQVRSFSDVDYYNEPFEKLLTSHDGETFNIGADKPTTILELAIAVQKVAFEFGSRVEIKHAEARNEVHTAFCDHTKAKKLLGFKDDTEIEELIRKMYVWADSQPRREVKHVKPEIAKNLYSYWK